jgi:hypothetical protein
MALYLFLVVVGNKGGRSFYGEQTIIDILRFTVSGWRESLKELIESDLIEYRRPYFWVKNLPVGRPAGKERYGRGNKEDPIPEGRSETVVSSDRGGDWHTPKEGIQALLRGLGR